MGAEIEGGTRWVTGFLSLGYTPALDWGNRRVTPDWLGVGVGVRAMGGGRRFKGWLSASIGSVAASDNGPVLGTAIMCGGRWFMGPWFFLDLGIGASFPWLWNGYPLLALSFGGGFEFFGR
jgi:hypothetical protein